MVEHKCPKGDSWNEARLERVNGLLKSSQEDGVSAFGFSALISFIVRISVFLIWGIFLCTALEVQVKVGSKGQSECMRSNVKDGGWGQRPGCSIVAFTIELIHNSWDTIPVEGFKYSTCL
ncbi:hypothetical protein LOTGIDRAFT_175222 [Lottia gigantea]|uniref:Uncharacterized protein n=1 Tax=Lottia gigantea TaxID=225164 RepID=V3ZUQ2_LOTGI|nr:hypothetical protein LOTGIDRAFT_175222 [Lottia gigantea]ESO95218.1 hypothetical protein LOTGIDRAFT_175222 [Lottia gigantea]